MTVRHKTSEYEDDISANNSYNSFTISVFHVN